MTQNGLTVSGRVFCKYCPGLKNLSVTRIAPGVHTPGTPGSLKSKKTAFFGSKWLWISTKIGRGHLQAMAHLFKKYKTPTMYPCWVIVFTSFFTFWPLVTPNDLWPPPKTIGIIYSIWPTHTPSMRFIEVIVLEIERLQAKCYIHTHIHTYTHTHTHTHTRYHNRIDSSDYVKESKMEPTAVALGAQHKQWSRENKPVSHNWKKGRGQLDLNQ